jgi:hypothetical protein
MFARKLTEGSSARRRPSPAARSTRPEARPFTASSSPQAASRATPHRSAPSGSRSIAERQQQAKRSSWRG